MNDVVNVVEEVDPLTAKISTLLGDFHSTFDEETISLLDGPKGLASVVGIPTGALSLDIATGVGGIPRGRITEIYGPESAGKSTLAMHITAEAQRIGGIVAYVDMEHAIDPEYARNIGMNTKQVMIAQPNSGEDALDLVEALVRSGEIDVVVVDSVAALVPKAELEGNMGDSHMGLQARLINQALRKLSGEVARSKTALIFINQLREKVGIVFGNPEVTPGGRGLKFYASLRIEVRRREQLKLNNEVVGLTVRCKCVKNKVAPPMREAHFDIMFVDGEYGISKMGCLIDIGYEKGVLKRAGAHYSFGDLKLGNGKPKAKQFLLENQEIAQEIEDAIRSACGLQTVNLIERP